MLAGLHLPLSVSPKPCRPLMGCWRMPAGVHGLAGFDTRSLAAREEGLGKLSLPIVASTEAVDQNLVANAEGITWVPGSSPGCSS